MIIKFSLFSINCPYFRGSYFNTFLNIIVPIHIIIQDTNADCLVQSNRSVAPFLMLQKTIISTGGPLPVSTTTAKHVHARIVVSRETIRPDLVNNESALGPSVNLFIIIVVYWNDTYQGWCTAQRGRSIRSSSRKKAVNSTRAGGRRGRNKIPRPDGFNRSPTKWEKYF